MATIHQRRGRDLLLQALITVGLTGATVFARTSFSAESRTAATSQPTPCFLRRNWTGTWKVTPDARTMYINVSGSIYRLDLAAAYPLLKSPWAVLRNVEANDAICRAIDFRFSVTDRIGNSATPIVKKLTLLSAAQAAALPKSLRP
jgi:hypothetical protein